MNPYFSLRSPVRGGRAAANAPRFLQGVAQRNTAAAMSAAGAHQVVQLYKPTSQDLKAKREFNISIDRGKTWFKATIFKIDRDRGWTFIDKEKKQHFIANHKFIKEIKDEEEDAPENGKKRPLFDAMVTYSECQFPGCSAKFENKDELYKHMQFNHPFPEEGSYPYLLFGGQSALTHTLSKKNTEGEEAPTFTRASKPTGSGYHSEWNASRELPRKKLKGRSEPEFSATTSLPSFMSKGSDAPQSLFLTGEPHCGLCSNTLPKAGLPVAYPTNARPSQSSGYAIPKKTPQKDKVFTDFVGKPDFDTPDYRSFKREHFPSTLDTAPQHNKNLAEQHKKDGGDQYLRFMAQSMALTKDRYDTFFSEFGDSEKDRDGLKKKLAEHPIPETPHTFMPYCPSPIWKPNDSEETPMELDEQHEANRKKIELERAIMSISMAYNKIKQSGKIRVTKKEKAFSNPLGINNCLITALNSGEGANIDTVAIIRTLIKDEVGTEFGEFLQARPEVIYTIAKSLGIIGKQIRIYERNEEEASQIFIVQNDGAVIEIEGDEAEDYPVPPNGYIHIEHQGGNHFEFLPGD